MTTKEDWEFREDYFISAALRLEQEAARLREEALQMRRSAKVARANQQRTHNDSP